MDSKQVRILACATLIAGALAFSGCLTAPAAAPNPAAATIDIPGLEMAQWITPPRDSVNRSAPGHIYVLEFWATRCGPCRQSIPHLNEIHELFGDLAAIVALTNESPDRVRDFVRSMGDYLDDAVVRERYEVREEISVSGRMLYNREPITTVVSQIDDLYVIDRLFSRTVQPPTTAGVGFDLGADGGYRISGSRTGSYSMTVFARAGNDRSYGPGNHLAVLSGSSLSEDSELDIDLFRVIRPQAPHDNARGYDYPQTVRAGTVAFRWDPIPDTHHCNSRMYDNGEYSSGDTSETEITFTIRSGHDYGFSLYALDSSDEIIGNLYVYADREDGREVLYGSPRFRGE
jgi:thiol-disulfide isomerase/thioredoxin